MLTPCRPCICPGAPCEHCLFGYNSEEENHELMKEMLSAYLAEGEKARDWRTAAAYMVTHPKWRAEAGVDAEPEVKPDATKILRSVKVTLDPNELTKMIHDYLVKEGFEVCDVEFKTGSHIEGVGRGEHLIYTFDGCVVKCRLATERCES